MKVLMTASLLALAIPAAAAQVLGQQAPQPTAQLKDERGFINVWLLRDEVRQVEAARVSEDTSHCRDQDSAESPPADRRARLQQRKAQQECVQQWQDRFTRYLVLRHRFNQRWNDALLQAVRSGDMVAEVIWRQCSTTPIIDRSALPSTCDADPARAREAALRLKQIGFEAAFDEAAEGTFRWEPDQNKRRAQAQERVMRQMEAGVYGDGDISVHHGGNSPESAQELLDIRRNAVIDAASTLVRRSFTYVRRQNGNDQSAHAKLRLNRQPMGTDTLAWSANVLHSGSPYTGPYDPVGPGFKVYLNYQKRNEITVGGNTDAQYLRMLHNTLTRSEQRIDEWLQKDPRWAVFLLHRQGHHEWVPEGMTSTFGQLEPQWQGQWVLAKRFVDFQRAPTPTGQTLRIQTSGASGADAVAQFDQDGAQGYACGLRYSGGRTRKPEHNDHSSTATTTALGYLPALGVISAHAAGPVEPFAPMDPHKVYPQVLVQCPQGEWPDNRNKRFMFLANGTLMEVRRAEDSRSLEMLHWRRSGPLSTHPQFSPLAAPYQLRPLLDQLALAADKAEQADAAVETLRARVDAMDTDELLDSLAQWRLQQLFFNAARDFPENLTRLVKTPGIATKACTAYREGKADALHRFNLMVVLNYRTKRDLFTAEEKAVAPDCLRQALNDPDAWVRVEALAAFAFFAEEKDRAKLMEMRMDPNEDVQMYSRNALSRIKPGKAAD